ncbi:MAG TPA: hypothetical protein VFX70_22230 [Mycobacteriales bacterium]|nr:hypothetical protein [Mycobacteriales bacterium]
MAYRTKGDTWPLGAAVMALTGAITLVIVISIVLVLLGANTHNTLANGIHDLGAWFVTPFRNLFPQPNPKQNVLLNWGIGAVVYFVVGGTIARLVGR